MQPKKKIHKNIIWTIVSLILAVLTIRLVIKNGKDISVRELIEIMMYQRENSFSRKEHLPTDIFLCVHGI